MNKIAELSGKIVGFLMWLCVVVLAGGIASIVIGSIIKVAVNVLKWMLL